MATTLRLVTRGPKLPHLGSIYQQQSPSSCPVARSSTISRYSTSSHVRARCRTQRNARAISERVLNIRSRDAPHLLSQPTGTSLSVSRQVTRHFSQASLNRDQKSSFKNTTESDVPDTPFSTTHKAVPEILKKVAPTVRHENIYTLPNFLTTTRIITAPVICYALVSSQPVLAFGLFAYSSITDLVDGYIARRYKSFTVLGSILDPEVALLYIQTPSLIDFPGLLINY